MGTLDDLIGSDEERREHLVTKYERKAAARGITEADVVRIIKDFRKEESRNSKPPRA